MKLGGKPLYKWARARQAVACPPRPVTVHSFKLTGYRPPDIEFEVRCGPGTYVRSLAHALGEALGCGAHLAGLRRLSSGDLDVSRALPLDRVEDLVREGRSGEAVLPLEMLLPGLPKLVLTETGEVRLQKGRVLAAGDIQRMLPAPDADGTGPVSGRQACRLFSLTGQFLGLAHPGPQANTFVPFLVLAP